MAELGTVLRAKLTCWVRSSTKKKEPLRQEVVKKFSDQKLRERHDKVCTLENAQIVTNLFTFKNFKTFSKSVNRMLTTSCKQVGTTCNKLDGNKGDRSQR